MLTEFFESDARIQELRDGRHGRLVEGFAEELFHAGYAEITARGHIRSAEHLLYWIDRKGVEVDTLNEAVVKDFRQHLDRGRGPRFGHTYPRDVAKGARLLVTYLPRAGVATRVIMEPAVPDPLLLVAFRQWMRQRRGTCDGTLDNDGRSIRELLRRLGEDLGRWDAQSLRHLVLEKSQQCGGAAVKTCTTALRMFLRFLITEGKCPAALEAAIPVVAHWKLSSLPRYLPAEEVERVIAACDRATPVGRRDYAIVLLLARLGLRAGDIVQLRLGDIDWPQAWRHVSGKGRRTRLPLTEEVGQALASYLTDGRPPTPTDVVFVRARAPFRSFASHAAVSVLVAAAMQRAGIRRPSRGAAHILRHSAATAMLQQGASLQEIASILRHRSIATTQIYAKVDVTALRTIAQPWPEVSAC